MIGNVGGARPAYYDRTPTNQSRGYNGAGLAPHAGTQRWTYTVPTGKKARLNAALTRVFRETVAAPVGAFRTYIQYTPSAGAGLILAIAESTNNTVGGGAVDGRGALEEMLAGDQYEGYTVDGSTAGTVSYLNTAMILEFDA